MGGLRPFEDDAVDDLCALVAVAPDGAANRANRPQKAAFDLPPHGGEGDSRHSSSGI